MHQSWLGPSGGDPVLFIVSRGSVLAPIYVNIWDLWLGDISYYALVTKGFHSPSFFRDLSFDLQNPDAWSGPNPGKGRSPYGSKSSELH